MKNILQKVKNGVAAMRPLASTSSRIGFFEEYMFMERDGVIITTNLGTELSGMYLFKDFVKLITSTKSETLTLSNDENNNLNMEFSDTAATLMDLTTENVDDISHVINDYEWLPLPDMFSENLSLVSDIAAKEQKLGDICSVCITDDSIQGTDNRRAISIKIPRLGIEGNMFFLSSIMKGISKSTLTEFAQVNKNVVAFYSEDRKTTFYVPMVDADYIEIREFIESKMPGKKTKVEDITIPPELIKLCKELSQFSADTEDMAKMVHVAFDKKTITVEAKSDYASVKKKVQNTTKLNNFHFDVNPDTVTSILLDGRCFLHGDFMFIVKDNKKLLIGL